LLRETKTAEEEIKKFPIAYSTSKKNKTGSWRTLKPVIDKDICTRCMICWKFCPDDCIKINDDDIEINYDYCKGCGICANECRRGAIEMVME